MKVNMKSVVGRKAQKFLGQLEIEKNSYSGKEPYLIALSETNKFVGNGSLTQEGGVYAVGVTKGNNYRIDTSLYQELLFSDFSHIHIELKVYDDVYKKNVIASYSTIRILK